MIKNKLVNELMIVEIYRLCTTCKQSKSIMYFDGDHVTCGPCKTKQFIRRNNVDVRIQRYKHDAARRGKVYSLSDETARNLLTNPCVYCGYMSLRKLNGIDRRDNSIGYTEENCVSCCDVCNFGKGTKSEGEFIDMCIRVAKHQRIIF